MKILLLFDTLQYYMTPTYTNCSEVILMKSGLFITQIKAIIYWTSQIKHGSIDVNEVWPQDKGCSNQPGCDHYLLVIAPIDSLWFTVIHSLKKIIIKRKYYYLIKPLG